jgi:hypothetical protein
VSAEFAEFLPEWEGRCCINRNYSERGQAVTELVFQIPLMMLLLFAGVQVARVFYVYHSIEKALRGGAGFLTRSTNVNYCDAGDPAINDAKNFVAYGNLQGAGPLVISQLTPDIVQVLPERQLAGSTTVTSCSCGGSSSSGDSCDITSGGRAPDFVVLNLNPFYSLQIPFPFVSFGSVNLHISVRMPVTGS